MEYTRRYIRRKPLHAPSWSTWLNPPWVPGPGRAALSVLIAVIASSVLAVSRPNVIVIIADDIGAEGLACYGSTIYTTPNLDRMAAEGVRFENAYATPLCTPTRVMIMSGLYPNRTGFRALIGKEGDIRMPAEIKTFGHYFRDTGYQTAIAGKWQLGQFDVYPNQPIEHGFGNYCMWKNREHILMSFKKGFYVRDKRFRLHEDGKLYDIPTTSDKERYGETVTTDPGHDPQRQCLQAILDAFMAIKDEYAGATELPSENGPRKKNSKKPKQDEP